MQPGVTDPLGWVASGARLVAPEALQGWEEFEAVRPTRMAARPPGAAQEVAQEAAARPRMPQQRPAVEHLQRAGVAMAVTAGVQTRTEETDPLGHREREAGEEEPAVAGGRARALLPSWPPRKLRRPTVARRAWAVAGRRWSMPAAGRA
jgi:hypothetical protein